MAKSEDDGFDLSGLFEELLMDRFKRCGKGTPVKKPTTVFRIEMPNGRGPYNSGLPNEHEIYEMICGDNGPDLDCVRLAKKNFEKCGITDRAFKDAHGRGTAYGCDSMKSLHEWFPIKAREYLHGFGARVIEYQLPVGAPLAKVGHGEIIFDRLHSKRVREFDLVDETRLAA
jgi:hypothetical protein